MTKSRWRGSMKGIGSHFDPENEEELKWMKIEIQNKVRRILKLAKSINKTNKEVYLKKKYELTGLIEDFHKQYESLFSLYEGLREEVKKNVNNGDDDESDTESFYSPTDLLGKESETSTVFSQQADRSDLPDPEASDVEDTILKDKLTSTTVVKEIENCDCDSSFRGSPDDIKDLSVPHEESRSRKYAMVDGYALLKEKLVEREEELLALAKKYQVHEAERLNLIRNLEGQVGGLRHEIGTLSTQKTQLQEQLERKLNEAKQMKERNSRLEGKILEFESIYRKQEGRITSLKKILEENEQRYKLEQRKQVDEAEKSKERSSRLVARIVELEAMAKENEHQFSAQQSNIEKDELHEKITELQTALSGKEKELSAQQKRFEEHQNDMPIHDETSNKQVKDLENKIEMLHSERNGLQMELQAIQNEKKKLEIELRNRTSELEDVMSRQKNENLPVQSTSKANLHNIERKIDEIADEFRKQFEDKLRMLSRRIRVAELLHAENKEWCMKTKEMHEQEKQELIKRVGNRDSGLKGQEKQELINRVGSPDSGLKNVKDITLAANDFLTSLDTVALNFEERSANFLNRISRASCSLMFAKDWATRKNKALGHAKDDFDCLHAQLDGKEAEILASREKVWKFENKVRELEKMMTEKEEAIFGLQEEKREAIRQLCVWIDYHRSRSDYYKKTLSEVPPTFRRTF